MILKDENIDFLAWERILTGMIRFADAGTYRGIRFETRPKEQGHNIPHCHVSYQGYEVAVSLVDYKVLTGNIPPKRQKQAIQWVEQNIEVLRKYWTEFHDEIVA